MLRPALLAGALLLAPAMSAPAHSLLLESAPPPGAVLAAPPAVITLRFNSRIEKRLSSVHLVDGRGEARAAATLMAGRADELRAAAPPLPPGVHRVAWRVLSTDGHVVSGVFSFTIAP